MAWLRKGLKTQQIDVECNVFHSYSDGVQLKSISTDTSQYIYSNSTVAGNTTHGPFLANIGSDIDPLNGLVDPEGDSICIESIEGVFWDVSNQILIDRGGVNVLFELNPDCTLTVSAEGELTNEVFNYVAKDDNPVVPATANGSITLSFTPADNAVVNGYTDPNTISITGTSGSFVNYAIDTDGDNFNEENGPILAFTDPLSTTLALTNGDWIVVRTYIDAVGTNGPTSIDKKQIPTPQVNINVPTEATLEIVSSNVTQDNVSNNYNTPANYDPANDQCEVTLVFDNITHNSGATTTPNVTVTVTQQVGQAIDTAAIEAELISEGVTASDASVIAAYFSGTVESIVLDFDALKSVYLAQSLNVSVHKVHNYTGGITLKSISPATDNYDGCSAVSIDPANTLYNTFGSADNADGTLAIRFNNLS